MKENPALAALAKRVEGATPLGMYRSTDVSLLQLLHANLSLPNFDPPCRPSSSSATAVSPTCKSSFNERSTDVFRRVCSFQRSASTSRSTASHLAASRPSTGRLSPRRSHSTLHGSSSSAGTSLRSATSIPASCSRSSRARTRAAPGTAAGSTATTAPLRVRRVMERRVRRWRLGSTCACCSQPLSLARRLTVECMRICLQRHGRRQDSKSEGHPSNDVSSSVSCPF